MKTAPRTAGCSSYLYRKYAQEPQGQVHGGRRTTGNHGSPQRIPVAGPSVPKASTSDWTIMQSLRILTLHLTIACRGSGHVWKTAVSELTDGVDDMRVIVRNLKEMDRRVSPNSRR